MDERKRYIGDGVYASFDGWNIWLRTKRDNGMHEIALEPEVYASLVNYAADLREALNQMTRKEDDHGEA